MNTATNITALNHRFRGIRALYGDLDFNKFIQSHVCIYGCGGVGSWAVEAIARTAIGHITLIDNDVVEESNVNRQNPALESNMGKLKAGALADRLRDINPFVQVEVITTRLTVDNFEAVIPWDADIFIDAIDDLPVKVAIANFACRQKKKLISAGGSGGKTDPRLVHLCDLTEVTHDRLLKRLRDTLKREYNLGKNGKKIGLPVVSCAQQVVMSNKEQDDVPAFGAGMCVTATVGLGLAAWAVDQLRKK